MNLSRLITFVAAVAGSFYVLMTLSLVVHEVCGHLLAGALCGARSFTFAVAAGFSGYARSDYLRTDGADLFVRYAGIGTNAIVGLCVFAILRFRRPRLGPLTLPLFWLAVTESGHALGYALQGILFGQGDAASLAAIHPVLRVLTAVVVGALFVLLAGWALSAMAGFIRCHFESGDSGSLRRDYFLAFVLPLTIFILIAPGLPGRAPWTRFSFDGAVIAVLILGSLWAVRVAPVAHPGARGTPISISMAAAWAAAAVLVAIGVARFLAPGIDFTLAG